MCEPEGLPAGLGGRPTMARAKDTEVTGESASEAEEAGTEEESFALRGDGRWVVF